MSAKELNIGDYVRTKNGIIAKCIKEECDRYVFDKIIVEDGYYHNFEYKDVTPRGSYISKSSPNIIDLIEEGDYVNGGQVREIKKGYIRISGGKSLWEYLDNLKDIKSIVTKEQFESMEYKIGE